jgi:O-antigen ligase
MNHLVKSDQLDSPAITKGGWVEWPLLIYFMLHFFPPLPAALPNICLLLSIVGVCFRFREEPMLAVKRLTHPVLWLWLLLVVILGLSIFQVPAELQAESWQRYIKDIAKGSLFGAVLLLHVDSTAKVQRLMLAGVIAPGLMLAHYLYSTWQIIQTTGVFPVQRDYLYWLLLYFPFTVAVFFTMPRWRLPASIVAVGIVALAVTTGFRGAMLSLFIMLVCFVVFRGAWRLFLGALLISALGVAWIAVQHPEQGGYALKKLKQTDSSGRVENHWVPAWTLSLEQPVLGHGFGHQVFGQKVAAATAIHPEWEPRGVGRPNWMPSSPHSISFEVLFASGFPGLISLGLLYAALFWFSLKALRSQKSCLSRGVEWYFLYTCSVSLVGSYFIFAQFEAPAWRSFPVIIALVVAGIRLIIPPAEFKQELL